MAKPSAKRSSSSPKRAATARKKGASSPMSRFDGEALGLVLFALGLFLGITVLLPPGGDGFMARASALLLGELAWGAYLLPLAPIFYGILVFLGRDLVNLTRRTLGLAVVVLSLLCLQDVLLPGESGDLAAWAMTPLFGAVGYFALLLPLLTLSLGVEVLFGWKAFLLAKGFVRGLSLAILGIVGFTRDAIEARRDGKGRIKLRGAVRAGLHAHLNDLAALEALHPGSAELAGWRKDTRLALRDLHDLDEEALRGRQQDLAAWRELALGFTAASARDLSATVVTEAAPIGAELEELAAEVRAGRHELAAELHATLACAALERVRRGLVVELTRLATKAGALERDRARAEKALERPAANVLAREMGAAKDRAREWAEVQARGEAWMARARHYGGWPDLARRFDAAASDLAHGLADALATDPDGTLRDQAGWSARLDSFARDVQRLASPGATDPGLAAAPPVLTFDFGFGTPDGEGEPAVEAAASAPVFAPEPAVPGAAGPQAMDEEDLDGAAPEEDGPAPQPSLFQPAPEASAPAIPVFTAPNLTTVVAPATPLPARPAKAPSSPPWEDEEPEEATRAAATPLPALGAIDIARPGFDLLDPVPLAAINTQSLDAMARGRADVINQTLAHFGLAARVVDYARGPTVTRYEIEPAPGEKISRIASLSNDLARALAVGGVRVEAPVPGKSVIGLEVPNAEREPVTFHTAAAHPSFRATRAKLPIILGKSIDGEMLVGDLARMPHLLIAGSTGSGKSVCVNTLITSLLYKYLPTELRFLMVDPKMVELTPYDGIPHLVRGVVTNPADAAGVLLGAVAHMERRYKMMSAVGAKNLEQFNAKMRLAHEPELPHLVIIIDELADLMITAPKEVESAIMRLAQMARATGMHLVLATQRPSVDILTSLIKVNVPARIAFAVSSSHDSRTILDAVGAERLTGMGDMLFYQPGLIKPQRLQGPYISETESSRITEFLRRQVFEDWFGETYGTDFDGLLSASGPSSASGKDMDFSDPLLRQAAEICIEEGQGSVSRLQRRLSVGHARAGKLMDMLEAMGIVSKHQGSKPREVLINQEDLPEYFGR